MYHHDPTETVAMCCMFIAFVIWLIAAIKALITGDSSMWGVTVNHRVTAPPSHASPPRAAARPARTPRASVAQPMPASSLGEDDRLLAGAAKRMGISEEKLREWLAEGRLTIQNQPDPTRQ